MSRLRAAAAALLAVAALVAAAEEAPPPRLSDLEFMAGCFAAELPDGSRMRESYTPPRAGLMLGNSQVTRDGRTVFFELSRIQEEEDGRVVYVPYPRGRQSVPFTLVRVEDGRSAVFENLEHDFPQRIVYRRSEDGSLVARVEGAVGTELDVRLSADRVPFVIHDADLSRVTDGRDRRFVGDLMSTELDQVRLTGDEPPPRLQAVLDWANTHDLLLNIELKTELAKEDPIAHVVADVLCKEARAARSCLVSCFHPWLLRRFRRALRQRNAALRDGATGELASWDAEFVGRYAYERGFPRQVGLNLASAQQGGRPVLDPDDPRGEEVQTDEAVEELAGGCGEARDPGRSGCRAGRRSGPARGRGRAGGGRPGRHRPGRQHLPSLANGRGRI